MKNDTLKIGVAAGLAQMVFCLSAESVCLKGYLGDRLDAMIANHVVRQDVDYITAPFMEKTETKGWWQTEFWGKWMHSAVPYAQYIEQSGRGIARLAELENSIEHGIDRILASQETNGYIGNYPDELRMGEGWDVWGVKYTLMGLLHYYDGERGTGKADRALDAAKRLCDYVIAEIGPGGRRGRELWQTGNWSGYASSSILEPVVWLYRRVAARDGVDAARKYLDFAGYIVDGMADCEKGPRLVDMALKGVSVADRNGPGYSVADRKWQYVCKHGRSKAYEMMSCYQGLLEYCEAIDGKDSRHNAADLMRAAVMTAEDIVKEEVNLAGGCASSEAWFHGASKQHLPYTRLQETCVTTTWMRFCEKLLDVTDDPKWADQIERTFYNAYLGAMKPDGSEFAGYTPLSGSRYHGQHHCYMHTDCCTANGPRGFLCFLRKFFTVRGGTATFNFYASAQADGELDNGRKVSFDMYSLYPRKGYARVVSHTQGAGAFPLRFRIPAWCRKAVVKLNGVAQSGVESGGYFSVTREWRLGDIVEIVFEMPVVGHSLARHVAFTRGPVLLARDSRFNDGDMTEPLRHPYRDDNAQVDEPFRSGIKGGEVVPSFAPVHVPDDAMWMAFSATLPLGMHHENPEGAIGSTVFFCDYASAGGQWRPGNYYRTWFPLELANDE